MRSIPVDDKRMQLTLAVAPRQQSKANPFTGEMEWNVDLFVVSDERADLLQVSVPESGLTKSLQIGAPVQVSGLMVIAWEKNGKHGLFFRCDTVRPAGPGAKQAAA